MRRSRPTDHRAGRRQAAGSIAATLAERRARRRGRTALTLNLAPMVDVTFLLLIFFSVTTTFKKAEGYLKARLPHDAGRPTVALPISPLIVRVNQQGDGAGAYQLSIDNFLNTPATFGELTRFLIDVRENPGFDVETPVVIAAESDVDWDHVVGCWNAALRASCKNISFGRSRQ